MMIRTFANLTRGGPGKDRLYGSRNLDELLGGPGGDRIFGKGLSDEVKGGRGPDVLVGGHGRRDDLRANSGADRLRGEGRQGQAPWWARQRSSARRRWR